MIQGRAEVMNGISDNQGDMGWVIGARDDLESVASCISFLRLGHQSAEVGIKEACYDMYKLVNVAVGPVNF